MDSRITVALTELQRRLAEPLRIADIAAVVNLSPSRFAHLFRKEVGTSPMRHLQALRIERAGLLLLRTSLPIADVMQRVGYTDPSHFRRDFRRQYGSAPREWRESSAVEIRV